MVEELNGVRSINRSYVIDDGWNVPTEIIETIDLRIEKARSDAYRKVRKDRDSHTGAWLSAKIAKEYAKEAMLLFRIYDGQYVREIKELGNELQKKYGVTEMEAINILNGRHINEYVTKYDMINRLIPAYVDEQSICDSVLSANGFEKAKENCWYVM